MADVESSPRVLVVLVCVSLLLSIPIGPTGIAKADTSVTLELDAAAGEQTASDQISFTVTANGNGTLDAEASESADGGQVTFDFDGWEDLDSGASGSSSSWTATDGHTYRLYYEASAESTGVGESTGATEGTHSATLSVSQPAGGITSQTVSATVDYLHPQFGGIADQSRQVVFQSSSDETVDVSVTVENTGEGLMRPDSVSFSSVPSGVNPSVDDLPDSIDDGGSESLALDIDIDSSISEGSYSFTATVVDNLGNSESFTVSLDVEKPPEVDAPEKIDLGDVFVGDTAVRTFEVCEANGFDGIGSGVSAASVDPDQLTGARGSISFSGLSSVRTSPGGCDAGTAQVTVSVNEDVDQHRELEWTVMLEPNNAPYGVADEITVTARAIHHAEFGDLQLDERVVQFNRPRSDVDRQTLETTLTVSNTGHPTVENVDVATTSPRFSVNLAGGGASVPGHEAQPIRVEIEADADLDEGTYPIEIEVTGTERGTNRQISRTFRREVEIDHRPRLRIARSELSFGESRRLNRLTIRTRLLETLEYESITGLAIEQVSGPEQWLTIAESPPQTIEAGGSATVMFALEFDTQATPLQLYTWTFRVTGQDVETRTITVTARPESGIDPVLQNISQACDTQEWRDVACPMAEELTTLKDQLRGGEDVPQRELSSSVAAGRSLMLFISSAEQARSAIDADNHSTAQQPVVRMVAAYNLLEFHSNRIQSEDLSPLVTEAVNAAGQRQESIVSEQVSYLESQLSGANNTALGEATINRDLARIRLLQGQEAEAERLRAESEEAFAQYDSLIRTATDRREGANQLWAETQQSMFVMAFGRPLMLNPAAWDAFNDRSRRLLETYAQAADEFRRAGATAEVTDTVETRRRIAAQLQFARTTLFVSTGVYAVGFLLVVIRLGWGSYAYIRDGREAAAGDFLLGDG